MIVNYTLIKYILCSNFIKSLPECLINVKNYFLI